MTIRALIADDELLAREGLARCLAEVPDVVILAVCSNGLEAVEAIMETCPALALLDVRMPGLDGFDVVDAIGAGDMPAVIFDRAGTHLGDRPYPGRPDVDPPLTVGFGMLTADGGALFVTKSRDGDHSLPVLVVAPDGEQTAIGERSGLPRFSTLSATDGGWRMQQQRFWTRTTWSPDPRGRSVVFGEREAPDTPGEATYRVSRVSITGDTLFSPAGSVRPHTDSADRARFVAREHARGVRTTELSAGQRGRRRTRRDDLGGSRDDAH